MNFKQHEKKQLHIFLMRHDTMRGKPLKMNDKNIKTDKTQFELLADKTTLRSTQKYQYVKS